MEHYVTLFNYDFIAQGLALHNSMQRHLSEYTLWVVCIDDETYDALKKLKLKNIRLLKLSEFESDELKIAKKNRTLVEYCWTLTPFVPDFVFESDLDAQRVTYIDADMWFIKPPKSIYERFESSQKGVLITEHMYAPDYDYSDKSGKFCVQFMVFQKEKSYSIRDWWKEKCLEWCFNKFEDGKFGDQKYLDLWPEIFNDIVYIDNGCGCFGAPWNAKRFCHSDAVLWHFHGVRIASGLPSCKIVFNGYEIPNVTIQNVYKKYKNDLKNSLVLMNQSEIKFRPQRKLTVIENGFIFIGRVIDAFGQKAKNLSCNVKL